MPVLLATAYQPPAGYMAAVLHADAVVIEAFETYTKQTCRNHCIIYGPNGKHLLTIPVIKTNGNHTRIKDILISPHQPWQKIHWRSIETAYNNSPFFLYYQDHFMHFYEKRYKFLFDLNMEILHSLIHILKLDRPVVTTGTFEKVPLKADDQRAIVGFKMHQPITDYPHYIQVFENQHGFIPNLSILDLLFNMGPEVTTYLGKIN